MLLALYIFDLCGPKFTVSKLTEFAGGPATTALRWLDFLEENALVERVEHPTDARVSFVDLTDQGRSALDTYFSETIADQ